MAPSHDFAADRVIVVGLGLSGIAVARKLVELGAQVVAFDNADSELVRIAAAELAAAGVETHIRELAPVDLTEARLVVISPGVPPSSPSLEVARQAGAEVISEVELAYRLCGGTIVAITGTNGKTTTATLAGRLFEAGGFDTVVAGNIAPAFIGALKPDDSETVYVIEASSFQLATIRRFRPRVAVVLNITPDHLNWHGTMDEYVTAKARVFENQEADDFAVLNRDDETVWSLGESVASQVVSFSREPLDRGVCVVDGWIVERGIRGNGGGEAGDGGQRRILQAAALKIPGAHNLENALAATAAARCCGVGTDAIARALSSFEGVEHRLEKVQSVNGVTYWNDSKATNPDATIKALEAFDKPVIVLLGGRNKGNSFEEVARLATSRAKHAIVFGEAAGEIGEALARVGADYEAAVSMTDAVSLAARGAASGDDVLLSPACASFDEFDSFEHRGRVFKQLVGGKKGPTP